VRAVAVVALLVGITLRSEAQAVDTVTPLRLVRCAPNLDVPCLQAHVPLDAHSLNVMSKLDSAAEAHAWTGDLAGRMLVGPVVSTSRAIVPPLRLLILLDRSGSMRGEGIAYTRITLRNFIQDFDSNSVRVAVAGFESHNVTQTIGAARFVTPAAAAEQLARLQTPDPRANTALYTALVSGSELVASATGAAAGTQGAILLVTDGRNEVGFPGDDPNLLAGAAGLRAARAAIAASHQKIWIMGVGHLIAADTLAMLVGDNGSVTVANLDPNVMAERLAGVSRELRGSRDLIFGMAAGTEATLARTAWGGTAVVWSARHQLAARALSWRPPLFAMPTYQGVALASALTPILRDALGTGGGAGGSMRWAMALFLALAGAAAWLLIPRLVWMRTADAPAPVADAPPAVEPKQKVEAAVQPDGSGLRRDVEEVAPRKPSDATLQSARRAAVPKGR
jgi:Mg-chelatase subunit ChlD